MEPGGPYGKGGQGGDGGKGGAPVPIRFLLAGEPATGQPRPTLVCKPGDGGDAGEAGAPGKGGAGGPGGAGDIVEFLFFSHSEPPGPAGDPGASCPHAEGTPERLANCTLGKGQMGPSGVMPDTGTWKKAVGRETPELKQVFSDFEAKRYAVVVTWFEFHWWRLYERVARTSLELIAKHVEGEDPLDELLKGELDRQVVPVVAERWSRAFLDPVQRQLKLTAGRDAALEKLLQSVLATAEPFNRAIDSGKRRGTFNKADVSLLRTSVDAVIAARKAAITAALDRCKNYVKDVLESKEVQSNLALLLTHYEIPACSNAAAFLTEQGVKIPIELALAISLRADEPYPDGMVVEKEVAPDIKRVSAGLGFFPLRFWAQSMLEELADLLLPSAQAEEDRKFEIHVIPVLADRLDPSQLKEFAPSRKISTIVGSLGLHKGYQMPADGEFALKSLGAQLHALSSLLVRGKP